MIEQMQFTYRGFDVTIGIDYDDTYVKDPRDEFDGISDETVEYWKNDQWHYVYIAVTASREGIELGTDYLGMTEYGQWDSETETTFDDIVRLAHYYGMEDEAVSNALDAIEKINSRQR